ncbi:hypothetical protein PV10_01566 [Exophiala mesophila]|uniref:Pre-mRNA-splicing factor SLU7 n=1 Tax=Exophiala mesophila TaxID=212818 RepID=A0A0D2AG12_EXOME|nr:uncharacterized protein PV10_01566 [Exophiala mesophila]KIV97863.1 hypothetical protein PV10_01566 [Exophiala mesophila]
MSNNKPPPTGPDLSRNEYIPSFISKRPFWAEGISSSDADYLEHQRLQSVNKDTLDKAKWYDRGKKVGPAATKFRKGACENCGAMTHKTKECLSRPRKQGARWTGKDIQADEHIEDVKLGFDAKRDRWNGYDNREYDAVVQEYEELETMKRTAATDGTTTESDAKYGEETDMGRSQPTSTRQLRLREDTAKYLLNLDLDSAKYDPKTRTMDTSSQSLSNAAEGDPSIAEENFIRPSTDDSSAFTQAQKYAWETQEGASNSGSMTKKLHLQANPTEGEILHKKQTAEAEAKKMAARKALLDKYGGSEHLLLSSSTSSPSSSSTNPNSIPHRKPPPKVVSSDRYVEYDESGRVKPRAGEAARPKARSKYPEDIMTNNHTSVWGSWWRDFTWGYKCCHSTVKNSYCTGEEGKRAWEETEKLRMGTGLEEGQGDGGDGGDKDEKSYEKSRGGDDGKDDGEEETDNNKVQSREPKSKAKKRTLQELQSGITEEELESYKRNRLAADDPMAKMLGRDELVS